MSSREHCRMAALALAALVTLVALQEPAAAAPAAAAQALPPQGAAAPAHNGRPWVAQMRDLGREATPAEIAAWDIDVRPDFKGLPKGQGSVADGEVVWDEKCASCHGTFGESNEVFTPLAGGTTKADIEHGLVAGLLQGGARTTLMKVPTVSTLWDYINRAMPWNAPRTLKPDEVYAALAYLLSLGGIVDDDFVLSDENIASVQERMPNRDGMTRRHGLWAVDGRPDVKAVACMKDCRVLPSGAMAGGGRLPDYARDAHGDLARQQRVIGPMRGAITGSGEAPPADFDAMRSQAATLTPEAMLARVSPAGGAAGSAGSAGSGGSAGPGGAPGAAAGPDPADPAQLLAESGCSACHGIDSKGVGPSLRDVAAKYRDRDDRVDYLAGKIASGGQGVWGVVPMPPQPALSGTDREALARWIAEGAR